MRNPLGSGQVSATHADPGKPAQPVTPAVVAKAVKKSAANTPRTPKGARQLLLGKIDAAIAAAGSDADIKGVQHVNKTAEQDRMDEVRKRHGFITFEVPGDGKFKVLNSKEALARFRKQVEKSPGFAEKGSKPSGPQKPNLNASPEERAKVMAEAETVEEGDAPAPDKPATPAPAAEFTEADYQRIAAKQPTQRTQQELDDANRYMREKKAREAEPAALAEKARQDARNDTDGFADRFQPMQRQRVIDTLNMLVKMDGKEATRKQHMRDAVAAGARVVTTPEGRALKFPDGTYILEPALSKTALDYAEHITPAAAKPAAKKAAPKAKKSPAKAEGTGDYGAELTANLRNSLGRALNWEDVSGLNSTLKAQQVVKSKVWPRPNYEALVQDGAERTHVRALKQVYDAVAAKPSGTSDTALRAYVDAMQKLRERAVAYFLDPEHQSLDINQLLRDRPFINEAFPVPDGTNQSMRFRGSSEQAKANIELANALGGGKYRNKLVRGVQFDGFDLRRIQQDVAKGWPAPQEAWEKSYELHRSEPGANVVQNGQRRTLTEPEYFVTRKGYRGIEAGPFTNRDQAVEAARELAKRSGKGGVKPEEVVKLERAVRTGAPVRAANEDISSERLAQTFGFRGINFGNWMQGKGVAAERQAHLNHAYDSFQDLAAVMGVPPRAMSLNGMLGLAIGAQGRKGSAAHFVPGVNEINLTREHGAGSLAHEWGHALDHYFAVQAGERTARDKVPFLTEHGQLPDETLAGVRPEVREAFRSIVKAMNRRPETPAERDARIERTQAKTEKSLNGWIAQVVRDAEFRLTDEAAKAAMRRELAPLLERLRKGELGDGRVSAPGVTLGMSPVVAEIREAIRNHTGRVPAPDDMRSLNVWATMQRDALKAEADGDSHTSPAGDLKLTETDFVREAKLLDGGAKNAYYNTDLEKFARAFQSYVLDKLATTGGRNDYLTRPQMDEATTKVAKEMGLLEGDRYPRGAERAAINTAFDTLVGDLRTRETGGGNVGLFSRPDTEVRTVRADLATDATDALWDSENQFYKGQLQGKAVAAPDGEVRFSRQGSKALTIGSRDPLRMGVLRKLEDIAKAARVYRVEPSRKGGAERFAYAAAPVEVDGTTYAVRMVYKIPAGESVPLFYTFEGYEILGEVPAGRAVGLQDLVNQFREEQFTFSRPAGAPAGYVDTGVMDRAVRATMAQWRGDIPTVRVVTLAEELPAQAKAASGWESAEGWYDGHNRIYIVAGNVPNVTRGLQVLAHEALGHYGVEAVMGKAQWTQMVGDVAKLRRNREKLSPDMQGAMDSAIRRYGNEPASTFAREFLAIMAERGVKSSLTARALAAVRRWLRSMGFNVEAWADSEVRSVVAAGARQVTRKQQQRQQGDRRGAALSERAGPFHSALVEAVEKAQGAPRKADAKAWKGWLDGAQRRGEFKQAERDWLELDSWLDRQTGPVTIVVDANGAEVNRMDDRGLALQAAKRLTAETGKKHDIREVTPTITRDQIAGYVSANQVRIEEVRLGDDAAGDTEAAREALGAKYRELNPAATEDELADADYSINEYLNGGMPLNDLVRETGMVRHDIRAATRATMPQPVKFAAYQLPGGQNYRELLLTMPPDSSLSADMKAWLDAGGYEPAPRTPNDWAGAAENLRRISVVKGRNGEPEQANKYGRLAEEANRRSTERGDAFRSSHWDQPNVLAHVRFNERTDADGKRVLFIEEIQSDWHQAGRKRGYAKPKRSIEAIEADRSRLNRERNAVKDEAAALPDAEMQKFRALMAREAELRQELLAVEDEWAAAMGTDGGVPDAPMKGTDEWAMLAFKRMVRHAAEHGFDRIAWAPGEVQADRYNLATQIDAIIYEKNKDDTFIVSAVKNDRELWNHMNATPEVIEETLGKEIAQKIIAGEGAPDREVISMKALTGIDLKLGGEGMRGFYDDILPKAVNRWAKKMGGQVGRTTVRTRDADDTMATGMREHPFAVHQPLSVDYDGPVSVERRATGERIAFATREEGRRFIADQLAAAEGGQSVPSLDLTDAMREVALEGMPLFSRPEAEFVVMSTRGKELGRAATELEANRMASRLARAGKRVAGVERAQPRPAFSQPDPMTRTLDANGYSQRTDPTFGRTFVELPAARAAVDAAEASGSVRQLLEDTAAIPGIRPDLAALAARLAPLAERLGVKMEKPDTKVDAGGVYNVKRNGLWIRQARPTIIVHEALHGVTSAAMMSESLQKAAPAVRAAVAEFESLREVLLSRAAKDISGTSLSPAQQKLLLNKTGPLSNVRELLAYGMTENDFQQWLASIPAPANRQKARNAWQWFKGLVGRIVGAKDGERTALDALIESSGDLIDFAEANPEAVSRAQKFQSLRYDDLSAVMPPAVGRAIEAADRWATKHRNPIPERFDAEQAAAAEKLATFKPGEKLSTRATSIKDKAASRLVQKVFDQFRPLKNLDPTAFMQAHLSKATDGALEAAFEHGAPVLREGALDVTERNGGFKRVLSGLNGEHDQFLMWVVGNRADALAQEGREHLFTEQDIAAMKRLNEGVMADGRDRRQAYGEALRELRRYNGAVLDIAERAGLIDADGRKVWESEFYIPFYRVMEDDQTQGPGQMKGLLRQNVIKRLNGGKEPLGDPLENILSNWSHMLTASMRNMAAVRALEAGQKIGIAEGVTSDGRTAEGAKVKGSVWVMQGGVKSHWIVHDPAVLEALDSLSFNGYNNPVMRGAGMFKRMLTTTVTISPSFRARNLIRDTLQSIATAEVGYNPVKNIVNGIKIQRDDKLGVTLLAGGGRIRFGAINDGNQARHAKRLIELGIPDQNILDSREKLGNALRKAYDWWQEFGDKTETVNRAMVYDRAIKAGKSHLEASFEARDVMNFTSMGSASAVRALAQVVPFFNARLQGLDRLGRGAQRNPQRFWATTGVLAVASALLYLIHHDDEDYKKLPDYVRDTYWVGRLPYTDKFIYIPKPFEVGALATIVERGTELAISGPDYEAKDFAMNLLGLLSSQLQMNPVPQIARPIMEAAFNYDMFRQAPIDTLGQQRLLAQDRYTARTSATAVVAGQATGISPQRLEHMVSGYLGWVGTQVLNASDYLIRPVAGLPASPQRDLTRLNNVFVLGDFVKEAGNVPSKYVTRFYETQRELDSIYASASAARKSGDIERAQALLSDPRMRSRPLFQKADKQITKINQQIRTITANRELGAREKNDRLEVLNARRNQIAAQVDAAARELE